VYPGGLQVPKTVYCNMATDGGGWTVLQRRMEGTENFNRNWTDYTIGFGDWAGEFWLGNDNIHRLLTTLDRTYRLRVDFMTDNGESLYVVYDRFYVGSETEQYKLISLGGATGTAGDFLSYHLGMMFSTPDQDNDAWTGNCAQQLKSGWWFNACSTINLNDQSTQGGLQYWTSVLSQGNIPPKLGDSHILFSEMKIKPN